MTDYTKTLHGVFIDPAAATVTDVTVSLTGHNLQPLYDLLGCDLVELVHIDQTHVVVVDEEGLLKDGQKFFAIRGGTGPLAGKGLVLSIDDEGEFDHALAKAEQVLPLVVYLPDEQVRKFRDGGGFDTRIYRDGAAEPVAVIPLRPTLTDEVK